MGEREAPALGPQGEVPPEPPHSAEAEQSVIGALLQDNGAVAVVVDLIDAEAFYVHELRVIFGAVLDVLKAGHAADVVTVYARLQAMDLAEECGGLAHLNELAQCVPSPRNARRYAEIIAERYGERLLIAGCDEAARMAWRLNVPFAERADAVAAVISRVEQRRKGPGRRVPLLTLAELRQTAAAVRWCVKHVIPANAVGMVFGGSGTFKSFLVLDAALHIAHGLPWMGRRTTAGPVMYIAAEGEAGMWPRADAWHRARNLNAMTAPMYVVPQAVDLTVDAWRVVEAAQTVGVCPSLVVVDTVSQTYSGDENSANEMAAYLREIGLRFRSLWQCSVVLVHHTGHQATERPRGSSAIRGNLDFMMAVFRDEKEMLTTLVSVKQKDGALFDDATFKLNVMELGYDEDNDLVTSLAARHLGTADEVAQAQQEEQQAGRGGRNQLLMSLVQNGEAEKVLRKAYYEALGLDDQESLKKAYQRAKAAAIKGGLIEVREGFVLDLRGKK